jgi:uncharacterized protein (DUF302 family)
MSSFGIRRELDIGFDQALERLPQALQTEGFGVLTEIDIKTTLANKLGVDFRRYTILGACNPPLAHQALETELEIGLMLPCNVVLYEADDGRAVVVGIYPTTTMAASGNPKLVALAEQVRDKLTRALVRVK